MFKNKIRLTYILLTVIFALGLFLRLDSLSSFPVGFHIDEASLGYNGYSLLQTGKDDNGNRYPLYVDMFGDFRPSGYHYLTILPIIFFGLTEFATRLPGALFGSLTIIAFFFFVQVLLKDKRISLLSAFLISIAPWHMELSRASDEAIVALFFIISGFGLFFYSLQKEKLSYLFSSILVMSISFFLYHTPRVFVPFLFFILLIALFSIWRRTKKAFKIGLITSFICCSLLSFLLIFSISGGTGRFSQVNIFSSFETDFVQKQQIQEDSISHSPYIVSRFFHNKITNTSLIFISNYLEYFSFNFLFTKGGLPIWYSIPRVGLIYILELPFIILGIYYLVRSKNIYSKIPIIWLVIAPIVGAITMDDVPNINRSIVMFPMLELIAAFGFINLINIIEPKKKIAFLASSAVLLLFNSLYFSHQYFFNARAHNAWYRNNGFSEMMTEVKNSYANYDKIIMSKYQGGIYPLVLFYMKFDPREYQREGSTKSKDYTGFGKFFFVPQDCPSVQTNDKTPQAKKILFIDRGDCAWSQYISLKKTKFIYREDGTRAFRIVYD